MYCRFINAQPSSAVTERARFAIVAIVVGLSVRSFSQGITNRMSAPGKAARMRAMNERRLFSKAVAPPVILWSFVPVRMIIVSSASSVNAAANAAASIESQLARLEPEAPNLWTRTPAPVARQLSPHNDTVPDTTSTLITLEAFTVAGGLISTNCSPLPCTLSVVHSPPSQLYRITPSLVPTNPRRQVDHPPSEVPGS
ncbi:Uncharacterised protein [Klebsiella pneumoniae]|nr:Uncharacterised protein [Klebsiella pneumoniae]